MMTSGWILLQTMNAQSGWMNSSLFPLMFTSEFISAQCGGQTAHHQAPPGSLHTSIRLLRAETNIFVLEHFHLDGSSLDRMEGAYRNKSLLVVFDISLTFVQYGKASRATGNGTRDAPVGLSYWLLQRPSTQRGEPREQESL